jgi:hypothetical protein
VVLYGERVEYSCTLKKLTPGDGQIAKRVKRIEKDWITLEGNQ